MRAVGELIAEVREALRAIIAPGITTLELNRVAEKMMRDAGAIPTFLGYKPHGMVPFPFAICASVNEAIVHGFSNDIPLKEGDIVSLDMAATYQGFVGDTAMTVPVGEIARNAGGLAYHAGAFGVRAGLAASAGVFNRPGSAH